MEDQKARLDVDFDVNTDKQELLVVGTARMAPLGCTAGAGFSMTRERLEKDPVGAVVAFCEALAGFYQRNVSGVAVCARDHKPEGFEVVVSPLQVKP